MKIKFLILLFILFFIPSVYAQEWAVESSEITSPSSSGTGKYSGHEYYLYGSTSVYNIGTRYNGRLSEIWFNLIAGGYADANGFEQGHTYTLTMNMATEDWRNNFGTASVKCEGSSGTELSNGHVTYISKKKIKVSFTAPTNTWCQFVYVKLKSTSINTVGITGVNNWNLSSMTISDPYYNDSSSGGSGGSGGSSTPSPSNQDIIDSSKENTQDIINGANQNTQDIIENNNQNTQSIIDNQNELMGNRCENIWNSSLQTGPFAYSDGLHYNFDTFYSNSEPIPVEPGDYYISYETGADRGDNGALFYNNGTYVTYQMLNSNGVIHVPNGANQMNFNFISNNGLFRPQKIMLVRGSTSRAYCEYGSYSSKLDDTTSAINDVKDTITNDNVDNGTGSNFFNNFDDEDFGLSDIITIPLTTIQGLTSKTCIPLTVPIPFTNSNITLPCMTEIYHDKFPSIYNLWKIVSFGIIAYFIATDIFYLVKGFKDPESDKVEVLDL